MLRSADWLLLILTVGLSLFGLVAIANARALPYQGTETGIFAVLGSIETHYVVLQATWIAIGLGLMVFVASLDYNFLGEMWFYIYIGNVALLTLVLFLGGGPGGVTRWFSFAIGENLRMLQPSEFCKIAVIVTTAKMFARSPITKIREFIPILGYFMVPLIIVFLQGDVGSITVYLSVFLGILFLSGTNWKLLVGAATTGLLSLVPMWFLIGDWRRERILSFLNPSGVSADSIYQVEQSMLAIGSGQMTGKGLFNQGSLSQLNYVPVKHSDFIFSVTAEAVGFWGSFLLVLVYMVIIVHLYLKSSKTLDRFGAMIIVGVASMLLFQTFENIAMTMGIMPVTGIPLPFVSYGGSAMLTNFIAVGLVLSVSMRPQKIYA